MISTEHCYIERDFRQWVYSTIDSDHLPYVFKTRNSEGINRKLVLYRVTRCQLQLFHSTLKTLYNIDAKVEILLLDTRNISL